MATHSIERAAREAALNDAGVDLDGIYREHAADVSRWVRRLSGARDAEDVLHEVFVVVQRRISGFRGECALKTWLYAITVRVVSARRRKEQLRRLLWLRAEPELALDCEPSGTPHSEIERQQATQIVYQVLDRLSERDRTLLIAFELEGLPAPQIAEVLSISQNNVWVGLHRARARFRKVYERQFGLAPGKLHGQNT